MKRLGMLTLATILAVFTAQSTSAQEQGNPTPAATDITASPSDLPGGVHPDVWRHLEQMRRYDSPRQIARMKAAEEAQQRRGRLDSQRWYGYTPLRPIVGATPTMGNYYPVWNTDVHRPYHWYGVTYPVTIEAPLNVR